MKIAGLDIGTTGCKLTVFSGEGKEIDRAYRDYPVTRGGNGHEVDAASIMEGVLSVLGAMAGKYPDICGIGVTSFGETFVFTDGEGKPLHRAMLYTDPRGKEECLELTQKMEGRRIAAITGLRPHEMYSLPKMMWVKKNRPEIYEQAKHAFLMEDYVVFHLTGKAQIDYSLAARTMAFDIASLSWSRELFEMAGIDVGLMSETVPIGTPAGPVLPDIAWRTGLSEKTRIVSISHDQVAAAVGAGVFDAETAVEGAGTVECITPIYEGLPPSDVMYDGYFSVVPYVIPGRYVCYAFSYTGGALIQWCVDTLAKKEKALAEAAGISPHEYLEQAYVREHGESGAAEPTGFLVLPHFAGAATPYMDTGSKGAVIGLTAAHTVSDIYRACMEGVAYEMLLNLEWLKGSGIHFRMLHATGGGALSAVWTQMKADILNIPFTTLKTANAGTVGSAMLTGIAAGCFTDLDDAAAHMVEKTDVYLPDAARHEKYMEVFSRYRKMYDLVRGLV
ncbi:MAG: carbohydrate kinase [Lachnospiraceae bacterium]|nr:carbohydrate kinase [Lachnospiraceae bacterium]